jgi:hypothetical protein
MVTATPTNVGEVVRQLLNEAIKKAAEQPQQLSDWFQQVESDANQIVDQVQQVPDDLMQKLKEPPFKPPDWWSLLVFMLLRTRDLLNDRRLTIGYRHPTGWSRMVTLNYSELPDRPDTIAVTLGVAITDPGVTHGLWLQVLKDVDLTLGGGSLKVQLSARGKADWQYVLGAAMTKPAQQARADISLQWAPWQGGVHPPDGAFGFDLGPIHLGVALRSPDDPLYTVTMGLGSEDDTAGVTAAVNAGQALGDTLASFIDIAPIQESYSPELVLTKGGSPRFSLGHRGIG